MTLAAAGVIAVVRLRTPLPLGAAQALAAGGITAIELTLTTPGALDSLAELRAALPDCLIGAGTVLDAGSAREVLAAGAQFVVSPVHDAEVHALCRARGVPYVPGAFTPTELFQAHQAGAELIKLFPAGRLGPRYLADLLAPMPFLRLVPSGGVSLENAAEWIRAGAAAVSIGGALLDDGTLDPGVLTERARALVSAVRGAR